MPMKKFFMPAAGLTLAVIASAAAVLVLIGVRSAETPNLGEMDEDGAKVCVIAGDCNWGDQIPDEHAGTIEIEPGVTLKQFGKDLQDVIDVTIRELKRDGFVVINDNPGGNPYEHWELYQHYGRMNSKVEVRADCTSACTLIVGAIDKSNLCFGPNGKLRFHQARNTGPSNPVWPETTQWMFDRYPSDIQNWIGNVENLPAEGYWTLHAQDLWKMGYHKCAD
jgi:hypothetical protein